MSKLDRWLMRLRLAVRRFRLRVGREGLFALRPLDPSRLSPMQRRAHRWLWQTVASVIIFGILAGLASLPFGTRQTVSRGVQWLVGHDNNFQAWGAYVASAVPWREWAQAAGLQVGAGNQQAPSVPVANLTAPQASPVETNREPLTTEMGPLVPPLKGRLLTPYGFVNGGSRPVYHRGLDFAPSADARVQAVAAGLVTKVDVDPDLGQYVVITHVGGWSTLYASLSSVLVKVGDRVAQGQAIGLPGDNKETSTPHLHFELLHNGVLVDPTSYLNVGSTGT